MPRSVSIGGASASGSTMVRRQLGRRLRELRVASGRTQEDVALMRVMSLTKLKQIESGRQYVKPADASELARLYNVDDAETESLRELAVATGEPGWWQEYTGGLVRGFDTFLDLESAAVRMSVFEPAVVYGLLQTEDYAMAVDRGTATASRKPETIKQNARLRTRRLPALLERERPPEIDVILGEAALQLVVGGPDVMAAQLDRLRELAGLDHLDVKVLRHDAGPTLGILGRFVVLDFADDNDPSVTFVETFGGARYDDRSDPVARHRAAFAALTAQATPLEEYLA